jgi:hypothetical protein
VKYPELRWFRKRIEIAGRDAEGRPVDLSYHSTEPPTLQIQVSDDFGILTWVDVPIIKEGIKNDLRHKP